MQISVMLTQASVHVLHWLVEGSAQNAFPTLLVTQRFVVFPVHVMLLALKYVILQMETVRVDNTTLEKHVIGVQMMPSTTAWLAVHLVSVIQLVVLTKAALQLENVAAR